MRYMNTYEIRRAHGLYAGNPVLGTGRHPVLGPAVETLRNLQEWTDAHSDGWAYWPKPARAASRLMTLIEQDGTWQYRQGDRDDVTVSEYRAALRPIKAFRTRHGADFHIIEL